MVLDALIAEQVMGLSLTPPRNIAMVRVAWRHIAVTGNPFTLDDDSAIPIPRWQEIPDPGTGDRNDRYAWYVASQREEQWCEEIDVYRFDAEPYTTDIACAWPVLERIKDDFETMGRAGDGWWIAIDRGRNGSHDEHIITAPTAPLAICRAALKAVEKSDV